jgi:hypothetical protein
MPDPKETPDVEVDVSISGEQAPADAEPYEPPGEDEDPANDKVTDTPAEPEEDDK